MIQNEETSRTEDATCFLEEEETILITTVMVDGLAGGHDIYGCIVEGKLGS